MVSSDIQRRLTRSFESTSCVTFYIPENIPEEEALPAPPSLATPAKAQAEGGWSLAGFVRFSLVVAHRWALHSAPIRLRQTGSWHRLPETVWHLIAAWLPLRDWYRLRHTCRHLLSDKAPSPHAAFVRALDTFAGSLPPPADLERLARRGWLSGLRRLDLCSLVGSGRVRAIANAEPILRALASAPLPFLDTLELMAFPVSSDALLGLQRASQSLRTCILGQHVTVRATNLFQISHWRQLTTPLAICPHLNITSHNDDPSNGGREC